MCVCVCIRECVRAECVRCDEEANCYCLCTAERVKCVIACVRRLLLCDRVRLTDTVFVHAHCGKTAAVQLSSLEHESVCVCDLYTHKHTSTHSVRTQKTAGDEPMRSHAHTRT